MERKKTLAAYKLGPGQISTTVDGSGGDALEMLAMLHRTVANLMLEHGTPWNEVYGTMHEITDVGLTMAHDDRKGGH